MNNFRRFLEEQRMLYLTKLRAIDPNSTGIIVLCPTCKAESWVLLPDENDYFNKELQICCPAACGHFSAVSDFSPQASFPNLDFDEENICPRDNTQFKTFGAIYRCPVCAIENPREIMDTCADRVLASTSLQCNDLEEKLSSLVSTFDGVMRQCNRIAQQNAVSLNISHPHIKSFQDIVSAKKKLDSVFDLSKYAHDWSQFLETLQKRHALSHSLGVIDLKYVEKTGVSHSEIGKKIRLSKQQLDQFANDCKAIVRGYYGQFLS